MKSFALKFSKDLVFPCKIALNGELGSGKTAFTSFLVEALGVGGLVNSPSYNIMQEYKGNNLLVEHWDFYRLNQAPEDFFDSNADLQIVEWACRFPELSSDFNYRLDFELVGESERIVKVLIVKEV